MTVLELILSGVLISIASFVAGLAVGWRRSAITAVREHLQNRGVEL